MKRAARFRPFFAAHPVRNAKAGVLTKLFAARAACGNFQGRPNFAGKRALGDFFCTRSGEYFYPPLPHRRLPPRRELLGGRLVAGRGRFLLEGGQEKRTPLGHRNSRHGRGGASVLPFPRRRRKYRAEKWRNAPSRLFQTPSKGGGFFNSRVHVAAVFTNGRFSAKKLGSVFLKRFDFLQMITPGGSFFTSPVSECEKTAGGCPLSSTLEVFSNIPIQTAAPSALLRRIWRLICMSLCVIYFYIRFLAAIHPSHRREKVFQTDCLPCRPTAFNGGLPPCGGTRKPRYKWEKMRA